ncbi:flagellar hook-length control protein FliK [Tritonibacter aquimaris]|nr:flagellar hook-length control protein FliK [Tritonibacter aquimaris]
MNLAGILQVSENNQKISSSRSDSVPQASAETDSFAQIYSELDTAEATLDASNQGHSNGKNEAGSPTSVPDPSDEKPKNSDTATSLDAIVDGAPDTNSPSTQPEAEPEQQLAISEGELTAAPSEDVDTDTGATKTESDPSDQASDATDSDSARVAAEAAALLQVPTQHQTVPPEQNATTKPLVATTAAAQAAPSSERAAAPVEFSSHIWESSQQAPEEGADIQITPPKEGPGAKTAALNTALQQQPEIVQDRVQAKTVTSDATANIPQRADTAAAQSQPTAALQSATPHVDPREKKTETAAIAPAPQTTQAGKPLSEGAPSGEMLNQDHKEGQNAEGQEQHNRITSSESSAAASDRKITSNGFVSSAALLAQNGAQQSAQFEPVPFDRVSDLRFGANSIGISQALTEAVFRPNVTQSPDTAQRIAVQLTAAFASKGERKVDVMLNPKELGRVNMQLATSDTGVKVIINAERSDTIDLMRRHAGELEKEFKSMGFETISFEFSSGDRQHQSQQSSEPAVKNATNANVESGDELPVSTQPMQTLSLGETGLDMRV